MILYVTFGWMFSDRVQALRAMLGDLTWAAVGVVATLVLGWRLIKSFHVARTAEGDPATMVCSDEAVIRT